MSGLAVITAVGAALPRLRLERATIAAAMGWLEARPVRGRGARSVCNWDEDAITLAVEAARALAAADGPSGSVARLVLTSTSLPFADRSNAALVAAALDLPDDLATLEQTGSLRAGTGALIDAAARRDATLLVAADARRARPGSREEFAYGHGAAALRIGPSGSKAESSESMASMLGTAQISADFVDHYRMSGAPADYALEERWVRDEALLKLPPRAIASALARAGVSPSDVRQFVMPGSAAVARRIAQSCGLVNAEVAGNLADDCGDTGTPQPLLMLIGALGVAAPGDVLVVVGVGQGVDALVLRAESGVARVTGAGNPVAAALARRRVEPSYTRYLAHSGWLQADFGMRAERDQRTAHSVAWRKRRALTAFVGGRCERCGTVQFPLARVCVNPECRATDTQREFPLAGSRGRLKTFTEDWQAYSPRPPYCYGNVEFEPGGNLLMELTDVEPGELAIGASLRFVYRVKDRDALRGFQRYFWKAAPDGAAPPGSGS